MLFRSFRGALGKGDPNVGGRGVGGAIGALSEEFVAAGGAAAPGGAAPGALVGLGVHAGVGRAAGGLGRVVVKDAGAGAGLAAASGADGATGGVGLGLAVAGGELGAAASGGLGLAVGGGEAAGAVVGAPAGAGCAPYSASRRAIAWSSAESSPEISASGIGGWMERSWPISALRARS